MMIGRRVRRGVLIRRMLLMSAVAALGLAFSPMSAHATETLSADGSGWAIDASTAYQHAAADAYGNLYELGLSRGETCTSVVYTTLTAYEVPGPPYGWGYEVEATGNCS